MLLRLFIVIRIFISLYTYNIVMVCGISCAIAFIFIVANVYCCVFSHRSGGVIQEFVSKLSPENQKRYALITRERQGIYWPWKPGGVWLISHNVRKCTARAHNTLWGGKTRDLSFNPSTRSAIQFAPLLVAPLFRLRSGRQ